MAVQAVRALYRRFETLIHEVAKFGVVGGLGFAIDVIISNVLHHGEGVGPLTAKAISTAIAALFTYVGNRYWSFRHRQGRPVREELPIFLGLNVVGLGITEICIAFTVYVLNLDGPVAYNISGNLIGTGLATVFRFYAYKKYVFRHPEPVSADHHGLEVENVLQV